MRSLLFSETLQLVRTRKRGKNVPSAFLKKSRFAHFDQKLSKIDHFDPKCQKMVVFRIFLEIGSLEFLSLVSRFEKNYAFAILRKIRKWPISAKIDPNLAISSLIRRLFKINFVKK